MGAWQNWKENLGDSRPWHVLDPSKRIDDESISDARMEICKVCPHLIWATKQCTQCGCFMNLKTTLANAECPLGKWGKVEG